jgi:hypothetical protein
MTAFFLVRLATAGALLAAAAGSALGQAPKPWKHGIIAPKADAGFLLMAAKRGFDLATMVNTDIRAQALEHAGK